MRKNRPSWCPVDAEDWGWKALTNNRESPFSPSERLRGCEKFSEEDVPSSPAADKGEILFYKEGEKVKAVHFCDCSDTCCHGIHYVRAVQEIENWVITGTRNSYHPNKLVRCYVPKGGKFITLVGDKFARCDVLVTLEAIDPAKEQKENA